MSVLGIIALVFGVAGVLLTILQSIWCWPIALVSVCASAFEFYEQRLFGDMALQGFYFVSGLYGWWFWKENQKKSFKIGYVRSNDWVWLFLFTLIQVVVYYFLLNYFKGDQVFLDSLLTAGSITATYMMTRKWLQNWIVWVIIDGAYVFLYLIKDMWVFALLYLCFTLMAAYGYVSWKRSEK
jgi:nicotinamide mononucleotide transporter